MGMGLLYTCVCVYIHNSWDPPDMGMGLLYTCVCIYITHGILRTWGWGCCALCVCIHNSWDPPDMGMGLLCFVCVYT